MPTASSYYCLPVAIGCRTVPRDKTRRFPPIPAQLRRWLPAPTNSRQSGYTSPSGFRHCTGGAMTAILPSSFPKRRHCLGLGSCWFPMEPKSTPKDITNTLRASVILCESFFSIGSVPDTSPAIPYRRELVGAVRTTQLAGVLHFLQCVNAVARDSGTTNLQRFGLDA